MPALDYYPQVLLMVADASASRPYVIEPGSVCAGALIIYSHAD
jgi:hypothetical protein